ncbi:type VII secretion-associated serine protease mycosin [Actinoplanes sp. NPDC051475]|uniref:type VII secretion-associated serine protease mycosin n=1 Tax=Actinoplanes sp. NPDC051475 TaxID=3157225 RepID=UPI00344CD1ED
MIRKLAAGTVAAALAFTGTCFLGSPAHADDIRDSQWHLKYLKIAEAHRLSTGKGVIVAVIDSGVSKHRDLSGSVLNGMDFVKRGGTGQNDVNGHGTSMAGIIAAHGSNGNGVLGIAPDAKILPIRVLGKGGRNAEIGPAIKYAIAHGADVINISVSGGLDPATIAAVRAASDADVVVVAAAGNSPRDAGVTAPAVLESVVAAAAINRSGSKADISVAGPAIDLAAPGEDITTTTNQNEYAIKQKGTSDASAMISGAAALLRSKYPDMSAEETVQRLETTATDKGAPGVDDEYGHGIVNIVAALNGTDVPASGQQSSSAPTASAPAAAPTQPAQASPHTDPASDKTPLIIGAVVLVLLAGLAGVIWVRRRSSARST